MISFDEAMEQNKISNDENQEKLNSKFSQLTDENKKQVMSFIEGLLYNQK